MPSSASSGRSTDPRKGRGASNPRPFVTGPGTRYDVRVSPTPPPTKGIRHVALFVRDMATMEAFYGQVLGYVEEWRPSATELYLTRGSDNLALHAIDLPEGDPRETRLDHIGLLMTKADDVDAWATWLESRGVALDTRPRTHRDGARSFYARDPEGNRIQFIWHPPIADR
jgi:catechol 2,3-dioxygenase-like lactoylglutathione lyase family enzyme